jgi:RNA polymerase sigma factor FliA
MTKTRVTARAPRSRKQVTSEARAGKSQKNATEARSAINPPPNDPPPLDAPCPANIDAMWREYRRTGDKSLEAQLIVYYMNTHVRRIASRLHASLPRHVDLEDLVQQGYIGLVDAMKRFKLERDVKFETFSSQRIYGSIHDYLRRIDPSSRQSRQYFKRIQHAEETFLKREGRMPSDEELQNELRVDRDEFKRMIAHRAPAMPVSFNSRASGEDSGDEVDAMSIFEDLRQSTPLRQAERDGLKDWLCRGFDRRDKLILMLYFYDELTMKDVGRTLGISESRVSQRLDSIIKCLRSRMSFNGAEQEFMFG